MIRFDIHGPVTSLPSNNDLFIRFMHLCKFFKIYGYRFIISESELVYNSDNHIYIYEWYPYIRSTTKDYTYLHCLDVMQIIQPYLPRGLYNTYCRLINVSCSVSKDDITMSIEQLNNIINI